MSYPVTRTEPIVIVLRQFRSTEKIKRLKLLQKIPDDLSQQEKRYANENALQLTSSHKAHKIKIPVLKGVEVVEVTEARANRNRGTEHLASSIPSCASQQRLVVRNAPLTLRCLTACTAIYHASLDNTVFSEPPRYEKASARRTFCLALRTTLTYPTHPSNHRRLFCETFLVGDSRSLVQKI